MGGDPAARAHKIQREVKNPDRGEVPQTNETAERPFWDFLVQKQPFLRSEACQSCKLKQKIIITVSTATINSKKVSGTFFT